jgi:hypothetical protein
MVGRKVGSIKNLKSSLKKGTMGPIKYIPKNGSVTVRFLEDPTEWVNYNEHYDTQLRRSYPCIEDGCPGCQTDERKTSRYLANALDVIEDKVVAIQLPKDLTNQLVRRFERYDTLLDRDYVLSKEGEGLDTTYDADAEPAMPRKVTKYQTLDLEDVLDQVVQSVLGTGDDDDEDEAPKKAPKGARKKSAAAAVIDDDDEDDDEEDEDDDDTPPPPKKVKFNPPARKTKVVEDDDDDDDDADDDDEEDEDEEEDEEDDDEDDDDDDSDDDDEEMTEEDLKAMPIGELRSLAKEYGIDTKGVGKADLIEALLEGEDE